MDFHPEAAAEHIREQVAGLVHSLVLEREREWAAFYDRLVCDFQGEVSRLRRGVSARSIGTTKHESQVFDDACVEPDSPLTRAPLRSSFSELEVHECDSPRVFGRSRTSAVNFDKDGSTSSSTNGCQVQGGPSMRMLSTWSSRLPPEEPNYRAPGLPPLRPELVTVLQENNRRYSAGRTYVVRDPSTLRAATNAKAKHEKSYMLRPDSPFRVFFEGVSILALVHDSIIIPFDLAFDTEAEVTRSTLLISLVVWTLDIVMNFVTGYHSLDGEIEMRWSRVANKYIRTWFFMDCAIAGSDWISHILEHWAEIGRLDWLTSARLLRMVRISRLFRIMGLARILRMSPRFVRLSSNSASSTWLMIFQAFKILAGILWINHLSSCVWYWIGRGVKEGYIIADTGQTWLDQQVGSSQSTYYEAPKAFQYTTSMHWSMTQMTPGSMAVVPRNSYERTWNIICLVFGLLFGTSLVGQLSSKMVQFNMSRQVEIRRMETLRRFLRENSVSASLTTRIITQVAGHLAVKTKLGEQDVEDLSNLPRNVLAELRREVFVPHLAKHPLISVLGMCDTSFTKTLCASGGIKFECLQKGHDLFQPQTPADKTYLCLQGSLSYTVEISSPHTVRDTHINSLWTTSEMRVEMKDDIACVVKSIHSGVWLCEAALWMVWNHMGSLEAVAASAFMTVSSSTLVTALGRHPAISEICIHWCKALRQEIFNRELCVTYDLEAGMRYGAIVMLMPETCRNFIARCAMDVLEGPGPTLQRYLTLSKGLRDLEDEVQAGKCVLNIEGSGEFIRTVPVVALYITRSGDGKFLVQIAKYKERGSHWQPSVMLPGTKMQIGDNARTVATSVLQEDLEVLAEHIEIGHASASCETKDSASYGVKSVYLRTVFSCTLRSDSEAAEHFSKVIYESDVELPGLSPNGARVVFIKDKKGQIVMYSWLSKYEFQVLQAGSCDDEIKNLDATAMASRESRRLSPILKGGSLLGGMVGRLSKSDSTKSTESGVERDKENHAELERMVTRSTPPPHRDSGTQQAGQEAPQCVGAATASASRQKTTNGALRDGGDANNGGVPSSGTESDGAGGSREGTNSVIRIAVEGSRPPTPPEAEEDLALTITRAGGFTLTL